MFGRELVRSKGWRGTMAGDRFFVVQHTSTSSDGLTHWRVSLGAISTLANGNSRSNPRKNGGWRHGTLLMIF